MCCENVFSVQVSTKEFFFTLAAIAAEVSEVSKNGIKKHGILKITKKPRKKQSFFFFRKVILLKLFLTLFAGDSQVRCQIP